MKVTVSVPDDLWAEASPEDSSGPSDTVQRALRLLREDLRASRRPLANAPDQGRLDRYRPMFEQAVETAAKSIEAVLDNGYRFGLLLAPGLTPADFEVIDRRDARAEIQQLVWEWGDKGDSAFSWEFVSHIQQSLGALYSDEADDRLRLLEDVLGGEDDLSMGVIWTPAPDGEGRLLPRLTDTFADGVLGAFRDVRDEATRRMNSDRTGQTGGL